MSTTSTRAGKKPDYRLPAIWNCWGYTGSSERRKGEITVHPLQYVAACLQWIHDRSQFKVDYAGRSLSQVIAAAAGRTAKSRHVPHPGDWIASQTLYGMMIRMTTAWDHNGDGKLTADDASRRRRYAEFGTFLKSCLLMPMLAKMGITTLYLLPVVKVSNLFRKGELGCPYSAKDFLRLDRSQHDPLYGTDPESVIDEFGVFVECAHRLGMRVMLDLAPRTAARDCDWILEKPEWFYWIDRRFTRNWAAPALPGINYGTPIRGRLAELYEVPSVREHLAKFRFAPNLTHPREWKRFVAEARTNPPADLMRAIADRFGVITPPGFSDVINDPQPPWSDVTYLRLYNDHPPEAAALLPDPARQPPYVLFDTIKSNRFPGRKPQRELWDRLAGILPFYQQFGIDGARIDMAHALPGELERMILDRPRRRDPDFSYLAEDLGYDNHNNLRKAGYNSVIGPCWYFQPRASEGLMHKLLKDLPTLKVPVLAAPETPDTPRAAVRKGGPRFSRQAAVVNLFLPNAVPMINSGMEVFERQPMNLGLDCGKPGRFALPKSDPQYGKLAFFDPYALHWSKPGGPAMVDLIGRASAVRRRYLRDIARKTAYFAPKLGKNGQHILATGFAVERGRRSLLMLANVDFERAHSTTVQGLRRPGKPEVLLEIEPSTAPKVVRGRLQLRLAPGDVKLILV
jgi:hypothetical protein